ncbi:MAG: hypothetical protein ACXVHT_12725 [Methanobacterium sp.]
MNLPRKGQEFRNFRELAIFMGENRRNFSSSVRAALKKEWNRFFIWESSGTYSIKIIEVFLEAKERKRVTRSSQYDKHLAFGLLNATANPKYKTFTGSINADPVRHIESLKGNDQEIVEIVITYRELWRNIGLPLPKTAVKRAGLPINIFPEHKDRIDKDRIFNSIISSIDEKFRKTMNAFLERMSKRSLLTYRKVDIVIRNNKWYLLSSEEAASLNEAKLKALKKIGLTTIQQVIFNEKYERFTELTVGFFKPCLEISGFCSAYQIAFQPCVLYDFIENEFGFIPSKEQSQEELLNLILYSFYKSDKKKLLKEKEDDNVVPLEELLCIPDGIYISTYPVVETMPEDNKKIYKYLLTK